MSRTDFAGKFTTTDLLLAAGWYIGYLLLMVTVPYHVAAPEGVASGATIEGYNNSTAYSVAIGWSLLGMLLFAIKHRSALQGTTDAGTFDTAMLRRADTRDRLELAVVFILCILLYFPLFLAHSGPFIEDSLMLSMLHRMQGGQQPFTDFKFLYSPLMIYPVHAWINQFGYSMVSYYSYLAILVGFQFAMLLAILQRFFPAGMMRYVIFLLIAAFLVETLLGTHWNGTRRLIPVIALLMISIAPRRTSTIILSGLIFGFMLAYSHDFGVAGLIGVIAIYGMTALREDFRGNFIACTGIGAIASVTWLAITLALMGSAFPDYMKLVLYLVERYSMGEAGFTFYWTLNSLAVFGLVWLACVILARGLPAWFGDVIPAAGDRMLIAGIAYAFIIFKTGLNRSDFWHLDAVIIPLLFAFLLPLPRNVFRIPAGGQRLAQGLITVAAITYLIGSLPSGSFYFQGYINGMKNTLAPESVRTTEPFKTAAPSLLWESGREPDPDILAMTRFLAEDSNFGKPVLFYLETWGLDKLIGVYRTEYQVDDLVFSDEAGFRIRDYLEENPDAFVLIRRPSYERLFGLRDPADFSDYQWMQGSTTKRVAAVTSSVHYSGVIAERKALEARMNRTVGPYIKEHFAPAGNSAISCSCSAASPAPADGQ